MPHKKSDQFSQLGIEAITFDLDDTLWPCAPAIAGAERAYFDWIESHFPSVVQQYDAAKMLDMRRSLLISEPDLKNDVTELRRRATRSLLEPFGAKESDVDEVMRVCISARQNVSLYDDVLAGLQQLSEQYQLGSITNGNADLSIVGIRQFFNSELAATMVLPAKPAPELFYKACAELGVGAEAVLHVGDHPVNDVAAARDAGMKTAFINRTGEPCSDDKVVADFYIDDLHDLAKLALSEV